MPKVPFPPDLLAGSRGAQLSATSSNGPSQPSIAPAIIILSHFSVLLPVFPHGKARALPWMRVLLELLTGRDALLVILLGMSPGSATS